MGRGVVPGHNNRIAAAIAITTIATFLAALRETSNLAQTSDSVQGFVVGHAIANGNILLSGWHFPIDNFYFTDSLPYAAAEAIMGSRPYLVTVIPALTYACLVLLTLLLCVRSRRPTGANLEPVAATILLLGVPVSTGAWNPMLMSDMHMATVVAAMIALALFASVATAEAGGGFVAVFAFLMAALITASDPFGLVFAFGPAVAVLAIEALHNRSVPKVRFTLGLLAAAVTMGLLLPYIDAHMGGFTTENDIAFGVALPARWWANFLDAVFGILTLWGTNPLNVDSVSQGLTFAIRFAVLVFVLSSLIYLARNDSRGGRLSLLDRMFCAGAAVSFAACISSAQFAKGVKPETMWHGGPPMRFLVPAVLFASIVACRHLARAFDSWPTSRVRIQFRTALLVIAALLLLAGVTRFLVTAEGSRRIDSNPAIIASRWLEQRRLSQGAGEYWSANLLTAMSGTAIAVRSMVPKHGGLVPYIWVEARGSYSRPPQFAVWQEPNQTGWTEAAVRATWPVCTIKTVAGYRIALLQSSAGFATCSQQ